MSHRLFFLITMVTFNLIQVGTQKISKLLLKCKTLHYILRKFIFYKNKPDFYTQRSKRDKFRKNDNRQLPLIKRPQ